MKIAGSSIRFNAMNIPSRIGTSFLRRLTPPRIFILSFALLILIGAVLLWLPLTASRGHLSFVDALFSSASAVCVTGLAVIDIGKDLSLTGQMVTLILFQVGGLGIITFSVVVFGMMGRGISFQIGRAHV
jgi:trk system potassium uptake protein